MNDLQFTDRTLADTAGLDELPEGIDAIICSNHPLSQSIRIFLDGRKTHEPLVERINLTSKYLFRYKEVEKGESSVPTGRGLMADQLQLDADGNPILVRIDFESVVVVVGPTVDINQVPKHWLPWVDHPGMDNRKKASRTISVIGGSDGLSAGDEGGEGSTSLGVEASEYIRRALDDLEVYQSLTSNEGHSINAVGETSTQGVSGPSSVGEAGPPGPPGDDLPPDLGLYPGASGPPGGDRPRNFREVGQRLQEIGEEIDQGRTLGVNEELDMLNSALEEIAFSNTTAESERGQEAVPNQQSPTNEAPPALGSDLVSNEPDPTAEESFLDPTTAESERILTFETYQRLLGRTIEERRNNPEAIHRSPFPVQFSETQASNELPNLTIASAARTACDVRDHFSALTQRWDNEEMFSSARRNEAERAVRELRQVWGSSFGLPEGLQPARQFGEAADDGDLAPGSVISSPAGTPIGTVTGIDWGSGSDGPRETSTETVIHRVLGEFIGLPMSDNIRARIVNRTQEVLRENERSSRMTPPPPDSSSEPREVVNSNGTIGWGVASERIFNMIASIYLYVHTWRWSLTPCDSVRCMGALGNRMRQHTNAVGQHQSGDWGVMTRELVDELDVRTNHLFSMLENLSAAAANGTANGDNEIISSVVEVLTEHEASLNDSVRAVYNHLVEVTLPLQQEGS